MKILIRIVCRFLLCTLLLHGMLLRAPIFEKNEVSGFFPTRYHRILFTMEHPLFKKIQLHSNLKVRGVAIKAAFP